MKFRLAIVNTYNEDEYWQDLDYIERNLSSSECNGELPNEISSKFNDRIWYRAPYQYGTVVALNTEELSDDEYVVLLDEFVEFLHELNNRDGTYILLDCAHGTYFNIDKIRNDTNWKKWVHKHRRRINKKWWKLW